MKYVSKHFIDGKGWIFVIEKKDVEIGDVVTFDDKHYMVVGVSISRDFSGGTKDYIWISVKELRLYDPIPEQKLQRIKDVIELENLSSYGILCRIKDILNEKEVAKDEQKKEQV